MALKTKVTVEPGQQYITITRDFDLPVDLVFLAHTEVEIIEQWMGTNVLKLESRKHGGWQYETRDPQGNAVFRANGVIHDIVPNKKIVRTFEMENAPFDATIEFMEFEKVTDETSRLTTRAIYRSVELRDQHMKYPFAAGLNMGHNKLEEVVKKLKK
jgi:uncharacterized protein YndB with AHSA1/START domain